MAIERTTKGKEREERYVKKFERFEAALDAQKERVELAAQKAAAGGSQIESLPDTSLSGNYNSDQIKIFSNGFSIPSMIDVATVSNNRIKIPPWYGTSRGAYFQKRIEHGKQTGWKGMVKADTNYFTFIESVGGSEALQNQFAPDFLPILYMVRDAWLKSKPNWGKMQINSAFRYNAIDVKYDAHMCGMAVDIGFKRGSMERYDLADIAWGLGLRGVAVGASFVHIDCGPELKGGWSYPGIPAYQGPGSKRV